VELTTIKAAGPFLAERCTRCGECFVRCPYLELGREEAVEEIGRLIAGEPTRAVMQKCVSCAACDAFCPEGVRPYSLILGRWDLRYRERGLPARAAYMLPYTTHNYRQDMVAQMDPRERELLERWREEPDAEEMLYPGCNILTMPRLFDLPALASLPVAGDWSLCCGEPYYRLGAFEVMEKIARALTDYFAGRKIRKMVFVCPACLNMFRTILPERFGARFDFECEYLVPWLLRRLDSGELRVTRPLGRTVTIHDSCHGRTLGDEIMEPTRELLKRLGLFIVNPPRHHQDGICCGIAAGCNRQMPQDMVRVGKRALKEGLSTGLSEIAIYCTGCYLHLGMVQHLGRAPIKLVHLLEYLGEATAAPVPRVLESRTRSMLYNVITKPLTLMLSRRRYKVGDIKAGSGG